jgi:hypothetical protein
MHVEVKCNGISTNLLNGSHILATAQVNGITVGMKVKEQIKSIAGAISYVSIQSGRKDKWNKMLKFDRSDSGYLENILISVDFFKKGFNKKYPDQAGVHISMTNVSFINQISCRCFKTTYHVGATRYLGLVQVLSGINARAQSLLGKHPKSMLQNYYGQESVD